MRNFLSAEAINSLWISKLLSLAPRLRHRLQTREACLSGHLQIELGLDSLELFELAAFFHGMFHLMGGENPRSLLQDQTAEEWLEAIFASANDWDKGITFYTSGSTGPPKACLHDKGALIQEIETWQALFKPKANILRHVPPYHIYGFLFGLLLPDQLGLPFLDCTDQDPQQVNGPTSKMDWVIGFPELYDTWVRSHVSLPQGLTAICSTGPLKSEVAVALHRQGVRLIEIYGSSESAGIGFRQFPQTAYLLLPYWQHKNGLLIRHHAHMPSKIDILPMDQIAWQDHNSFHLKGRIDQAIQIGGNNVFPDQIARRIASIPGVQACWVRKMIPSEGNRLTCWIVPDLPQEAWAALEDRCYRWIEAHLSVSERPKHLRLSASPPLNSLGKVKAWSIHAHSDTDLGIKYESY